MSEYKQAYDTEWFPANNTQIVCCDCGLAHLLRVRKRKGVFEIRFMPLTRATGQIRRYISTVSPHEKAERKPR